MAGPYSESLLPEKKGKIILHGFKSITITSSDPKLLCELIDWLTKQVPAPNTETKITLGDTSGRS